mmetsp:Transcript_54270/g.124492  ORF Transcript_54270/g.124492 Transcript_54270/m.124492 type:complete len:206 (+) Transcript_54270:23-640(+)
MSGPQRRKNQGGQEKPAEDRPLSDEERARTVKEISDMLTSCHDRWRRWQVVMSLVTGLFVFLHIASYSADQTPVDESKALPTMGGIFVRTVWHSEIVMRVSGMLAIPLLVVSLLFSLVPLASVKLKLDFEYTQLAALIGIVYHLLTWGAIIFVYCESWTRVLVFLLVPSGMNFFCMYLRAAMVEGEYYQSHIDMANLAEDKVNTE